MQKLTSDSGIYILELFCTKALKIMHPKFRDYEFSQGNYYYIGSAQKNLKNRIARHLKKDKKLHWHIDYFTSENDVKITRVFILPNFTKEFECRVVFKMGNIFKLQHKVLGFGNSDCNICKSHFLFSAKPIDYNHLCSLYHSTVLFIPSESDIFCS